LAKSLANVKLCKDLSVGDSGERFVDQGKRVLIFLCEAVELTIVYTEAQAAVRLGDEEDRRGEGGVDIRFSFPGVCVDEFSIM
jgi:hypothetical protein